MSTNESLIARCDELTKEGAGLRITWTGGNDSGWFELMLGDEVKNQLDPVEEALISYVERQLGYGSFAGSYSTTGSLDYNTQTKCFEGTDQYEDSDLETAPCSIPIRIPGETWFDRVEISAEQYGEDQIDVSVKICIDNGPVTEQVSVMEQVLESLLKDAFNKAISELEDYEGLDTGCILNYDQFRPEDGGHAFLLKELTYHRHKLDIQEIIISLDQ
ncbi:MAG TPA: hypothetical protein VM802_06850 [Chitinophaga sp.]|uniref:hypothetical protein n=1 Tax=Chitinophaga sp. TaxID=1869181 RepID=UPI002BA35817|nr:hypothetical protein [Chitinophaga sp.]HVI44568.1 hypothetical protein [Chitinophaga sp.]